MLHVPIFVGLLLYLWASARTDSGTGARASCAICRCISQHLHEVLHEAIPRRAFSRRVMRSDGLSTEPRLAVADRHDLGPVQFALGERH